MATSIVSQLQRIKSAVQVGSDPIKRPFTRPSILYSPKDAADIDIDSILGVALSGLEALVKADERFRNYKNDLFSNKTRELDRELMNNEENSRIDESISLYLQLLSGYLHLPASLQTLEYLIRRYQIHERECNVHDLILCALPYHDTHAFVKIVQLLNIRDNKWKFLDGVKVSGAPPPRSVIVQQCIRDVEVLEALCDYASPKKKFNFSRPVISFCTAVFVEVLGSMTTINSSVVGKIYGFLDYGLKASVNGGSDHQAGALIIVGLLAEKVKLNSNLVKHWIRSIAEIASRYAKLGDEQWLWLALLALINLVQLQSVNLLPKNALGFLMDIRDLSQILLGLTREFDIERFLAVLVGSLVDHSCAGDSYYCALASVMEIVPMSNLVDHVVFRILTSCMRLSCKGNPVSSESGNWAKKTLVVINKIYPSELRRVVHKFLEDTKIQLGKGGRMLDNLCKVLDGNLDSSLSISNSKAWFGLHHPEASVRCATLSGLNMSDFAADAQDVFPIQDAILSLLRDDDLAVVKSSLSLNQLSERISCSDLLEALHHTLKRCLRMLTSGSSDDIDLAVDVAASIMKITVSGYHNDIDYSKKLAAMMFPLLLIQPKTQRLSLTALESAKEVKWPFFQNLVALSNEEKKKMQKLLHGGISPINIEVVGSLGEALLLHVDEHRLELIESSCDFKLSELTKCRGDFKLLEQERRKLQKELQKRERVSAFNLEIVSSLAETFLMDPGMHMPWLMESCSDLASSKTLFLLVLLQSFLAVKNGRGQFSTVFEVCFPVLKMEWEIHDFAVDVSLKELQQCECRELLFQLFDTDVNTLNTKILVCLFWRLLEAFFSMVPADSLAGDKESWIKDLFIFFAASRLKHVFKEHCHYLVRGCKRSPVSFLSRFFTEEEVPVTVQVESLHCFAYLCSENNSWPVELLAEFPAILVPLFSAKQDLRSAAMSCIEGLHALWRRIDFTSKKNGSTLVWSHFLDELLDLMIQQKELILSDKNYLSSFLISLLGFPHSTLSVPQNVERRLDQSTKDNILAFIIGSVLRLPAYGKLVVLSSLKGLGSAILCIEDVKSLLSRRSQYYFEQNKSSQKLSETEVKILCTLLEICLMPSSSFEGLEDCLLKALQLDSISPEDPGIAHPCITVLQKLNNQVYNGLKSEIQVILR
ncbi:uncharacterized protein At3g06530 [Carica papaya]|uniref:uncharacterized protein At3g06530 n=1 Tax=Carica papaya TaxID=3649 RepID=UPI000B8CD77E|nr:uncharacterized protein At3g06530 [Carica papaya]